MAAPISILGDEHEDDPVVDMLVETYERFRPELVRRCRRIVRDPALAEELAQEAFVRALEHRDTLDLDRPVEAWLTTVGTRLALDAVRRRGRDLEALDLEQPGGDVTFDDVSRRESRRDIDQALARLPDRHRRALVMYGVEGRTYAEIADSEGVTVSSVKMTLHRARARLRQSIDLRDMFSGVPVLGTLLRRRPALAGGSVATAAARVSFGAAGVAAIAGLSFGAVAISAQSEPATTVRTDGEHQSGPVGRITTRRDRQVGAAGDAALARLAADGDRSLAHDADSAMVAGADSAAASEPQPRCLMLKLTFQSKGIDLPGDDPPPPPTAEGAPGSATPPPEDAKDPENPEKAEESPTQDPGRETPPERGPPSTRSQEACLVG